MAVSYTSLEPGLESNIGGGASFTTANVPTLFTSASFVYTFAFVIIVVAASFRYAYAGGLRMQATEKGIQESKSEFKRVTYGLLGVFALWLILYTVNKDMLTGNVSLSGLKVQPIAGNNGGSLVVKPSTAAIDNPTIPKNNDDPTGWKAIQDDAVVRAQLKTIDIGVNRLVCINPTQTSCTTVGGLPASTITMLTQLRGACSGTITITGGSEAGHSSHGPGKTPVDLSIFSPGGLELCIRNFTPGPALNFCKKTYTNFGYTFCDEIGVAHWHVFK